MVKISQADIETFLTEHKGEWFTSTQLMKKLNLSSGSIGSNLRRAGMHRTIKRRRSKQRANILEYSITHEDSMKKNSPDSYLSEKEKFLKDNELEV